jgi:hypothetical protein
MASGELGNPQWQWNEKLLPYWSKRAAAAKTPV